MKTKTEEPKRAGIYLRISDDREGKEAGVDRQRPDCTNRVKSLGWTLTEEYLDNDRSASNFEKPRPAFERMLDDIASGKIDAVVAYTETRLARNPEDGGRFVRVMQKAHALVNLVGMGPVNLDDPSGEFVFTILIATATNYSRSISKLQKRKQKELREAGKYGGGGPRRFGYGEDRITVVPKEAAIIREAADRILGGEAARAVVKDLQARGIKGTWGQPFSHTTLMQVLRSHRIIGIRSHKGEPVLDPDGEWLKAEWDPILTADVWQRLRDMHDGRKRGPQSSAKNTYPLAGLVFCSGCGARLTGETPVTWKDKRTRSYNCPAYHVSIRADALEAEVEFWMQARTVTVDRLRAIDPKTIRAELNSEITAIIARRSILEKMWNANELEPESYRAKNRELNDREAEIKKQLPTSGQTQTEVSVGDMIERIEVISAKMLNGGKNAGQTKFPIEERVRIHALPGVRVKTGAVTEHPKPEKPHCTVIVNGEPCDRPEPYVKGMCYAHYHRLQKYGDVRADIPLGEYVGRNAAAAFK
jgi:site-specific DNA recombinase